MVNTVREVIDEQAGRRGEAVFLIHPHAEGESTVTFGGLKKSVDAIGRWLGRMGVGVGGKVAFLMDNGVWSVQVFLGVMASGRVVVPLNAVGGARQLEHVLGHADVELVVVSERYQDKLEGLLAGVGRAVEVVVCDEVGGPEWTVEGGGDDEREINVGAEDAALLLYTSGSTGVPKGAVLSHRAVLCGARNVVGGHGLGVEDRALCVLPVYHINGAMVTVCAPLVSGGSVVMPSRFSASVFWGLVVHYQCTWCSVVPTIIKYLLDRAAQEAVVFGSEVGLEGFRFARSASAPLPAVVLQQWEDTFKVPMIETLGLTETAGTVATNPRPPGVRKAGSVGMAYGNSMCIMDGEGEKCAVNTVGEIVFKGDNLLSCYYKNKEATETAFVGGWFRSGDLGFVDGEGYLFITGRIKELIIRGGENIAPREIDDVLYQHEAVLEAAAVGVEDADYGQEVVAGVALREGFVCSERELKVFCREAVGAIKMPKVIYFFDALPKGPSGKILRLELLKMIAARG